MGRPSRETVLRLLGMQDRPVTVQWPTLYEDTDGPAGVGVETIEATMFVVSLAALGWTEAELLEGEEQ